MKICKIWIKDWDQFKDIELDFTDPATGEPSEKICFIGSNDDYALRLALIK